MSLLPVIEGIQDVKKSCQWLMPAVSLKFMPPRGLESDAMLFEKRVAFPIAGAIRVQIAYHPLETIEFGSTMK